LRFSPRKKERKIFMGTVLPDEKKLRTMIEEEGLSSDFYDDAYVQAPKDDFTRHFFRKTP
jgi:hypothetical protein